MIITDKKAKAIYNKILCPEVQESIDTFPDDERDGKTDMQIVMDEIAYFIEMFESDGTIYNDCLTEAKDIQSRSGNFTNYPIYLPSFQPVFSENQINDAKATLKQYKQLKDYYKKYRK